MEVGGSATGGTREYPGRTKAGQYSEMSFEVPGKVTEFVYLEGALVEKNAVLARLDPRDYQSRLDSAVARLEHARSERDRYKAMYDEDVKPFSEYEMRLKRYDVRAAEMREAKKALDDTILRAPFNGVMARKLVEEFENVLAKQAVLIMQNDELLEIKVSIPERDLAGGSSEKYSNRELSEIIKPRVVVSPLPDRQFSAVLKELATVADPTTRTFEATFLFEKPSDANILGGMTAKIIIDLPPELEFEGLRVPATAVVSGEEGNASVWVVDPSSMTASRREVEVGEFAGTDLQVKAGLTPGEMIAITGVHELRDGMTVRRYER